MSSELELIRGFRSQDAAVDAESFEAARLQLLAHIDGVERRERPRASFRWRRWLQRFHADVPLLSIVGSAVAVLVVVGVVAVIIHAGGGQAEQRGAHPSSPGEHPTGDLHNLAPRPLAPLPGQVVCNADLAPPGATPGIGGPRSGAIVVTATTVHGVDESPFSLTAQGLSPTSGGRAYAVWLVPAVRLGAGGYVLQNGAIPRLLGRIVPGVGSAGRLAVEGRLPSDVNGAYLVRITQVPSATATTPGRTVLEGFAVL